MLSPDHTVFISVVVSWDTSASPIPGEIGEGRFAVYTSIVCPSSVFPVENSPPPVRPAPILPMPASSARRSPVSIASRTMAESRRSVCAVSAYPPPCARLGEPALWPGNELQPVTHRQHVRPAGRGRLDNGTDGGSLLQSSAARRASPRSLTVHGTEGGAHRRREATVGNATLPKESALGRKRLTRITA